MKSRLIYVFAAALTALVTAGAVSASDGGDRGRERAVFVQTNELDGNKIVVFQRHGDGRLTEEDTYPTGGNGGNVAPGTVVGPPGLAGLARLRRAAPAALCRQRRQRLRLRVPRQRDTAAADRRRPIRRRLPGEHRRPRRPRVRPERRRRRDRPGVRDPRRPHPGSRRLGALARAREHRPAELPHLARPGRVHTGREQADRDDEGERQHDRHLQRASRRDAVRDCGREPLGDAGSVRVHVRSARPARERRGRDEHA